MSLEFGTTHSISVASARRRKSNADRMPAKVLGCPRSGPRPQKRGAFIVLALLWNYCDTYRRVQFLLHQFHTFREEKIGRVLIYFYL